MCQTSVSLRARARSRVVAALDGSQDPVVVEGADVHARERHAQEHPYRGRQVGLQGLTFDQGLSWNSRSLLGLGVGAKLISQPHRPKSASLPAPNDP